MMNIKNRILGGIILCSMYTSYHAQQEINFGDFSKPVPSVSSLAAYSNAPVSYASGIPDISVPLFGLPTNNKNINLNLTLSYNPMNVAPGEVASDVGTGWSLFMGGVISRRIIGELDEKYNDAGNTHYIKNAFDDIYYYNLPGVSGKFKIIRDIPSNTFRVVNLSSNLVKIEYTRESNTATLILDSFTITDTKGIKYIFNDYSRSNSEQNSFILGGRVYKSAFFLSQIKDANNIEIANFSYQKDIKYKNNSNTFIQYQTCKLKTISSPFHGKIELNYVYNSSMENTMNDPYSIDNVQLKDNYNHVISRYTFEYSDYPYLFFNGISTVYNNKRILTKLKKINRNNIVSEKTEFQYNNQEYDQFPGESFTLNGHNLTYFCPQADITGNPRKAGLGVLKKIINPTGGAIEYNFEPQEIYIDKSTPEYLNPILNGENFVNPQLQYLQQFKEIIYDTNQNTDYLFSVTGTPGVNKKVYVEFQVDDVYTPPYWDGNTPPYVDFNIKQGNEVIFNSEICPNPIFNNTYRVVTYDLLPGNYVIKFSGSGGKGKVYMYDIAHIPTPFKNKDVTNGVRIANIKYYENASASNPVKTIQYSYDSFANSNNSSGYSFSPEDDFGDMAASNFTLYKNVKVSNSDDALGYIRYYYKNPDDYPAYNSSIAGNSVQFWSYFNLTKDGILDKKEIYNSQNQLLVSEHNEYVFDNIPGSENYPLIGDQTYSRAAYYKKMTGTSKSYFDNQIVEEKTETEFNSENLEPSVVRKINDDVITEKKFTYPTFQGGGYTQLISNNVIGIPVVEETKDNGKTLSKTETKFDNPSSTYPTSVVVTNISDGTTKTSIKFDLYDEKGNLLQFTSSVGVSTAIVYGYDKTQPIAKIEGATYAQVLPYIQPIIDASNADAANPANEPALLIALDNFRKTSALQNFRITTYTYDPLIGMTTTTPSNGIRAIYVYDADNRLMKIVDMNGVTLKEYQYNYKN